MGGGVAALAGKQAGLFGGQGNSLSPEDLARNNQIWDRLGRGSSASPRTMGPEMPMNPLAGAAPMSSPMAAVHRTFGFPEPQMGYGMPNMMPQNVAQTPPAPTAGLLGRPDESSQQAFLRAQGIPGQPAMPAMPNYAGPAPVDPRLAMLLQYRKGVA
jgi:hypothetical protein